MPEFKFPETRWSVFVAVKAPYSEPQKWVMDPTEEWPVCEEQTLDEALEVAVETLKAQFYDVPDEGMHLRVIKSRLKPVALEGYQLDDLVQEAILNDGYLLSDDEIDETVLKGETVAAINRILATAPELQGLYARDYEEPKKVFLVDKDFNISHVENF